MKASIAADVWRCQAWSESEGEEACTPVPQAAPRHGAQGVEGWRGGLGRAETTDQGLTQELGSGPACTGEHDSIGAQESSRSPPLSSSSSSASTSATLAGASSTAAGIRSLSAGVKSRRRLVAAHFPLCSSKRDDDA